MATDDTKSELEVLREEITEMVAEREAQEAIQISHDRQSSMEISGAGDPAAADLGAEMHELIAALGQHARAIKPVTLVAVFVLGVVVGRMLPR